MKAKTTAVWALAALNAGLLVNLVVPRMLAPEPAHAGGGRRPELIMLPGEIIGGNSAVVYLIDSSNLRLGAVGLDNENKRIKGLAPIDLERAFSEPPAAEGGRGKKKR